MSSGLFLGIDHGGSTTTALIFDAERGILGRAAVPMPKRAPQVDHVEHDAEDFVRTSLAAAAGAMSAAGLVWDDIAAMGIANQGETSIAWSARAGRPLGPAVSWEDRRTAAYCAKLAERGVDRLVRQRTGIILDPYFSASKFHWLTHEIAESRDALAEGTLRLGGTDAYVIDRLTGGEVHATDPATASRTALLDIRMLRWDKDLLDAFAVEPAALPEIRQTVGDFGVIHHPDVPSRHVRITADAVDAHAALFAQGCWDDTVVKATYGTGAFIEVNTGNTIIEPDGKLPVFIAWQIDGRLDYTLEGSVFSVGSAIDWAVKSGLLPSAAASSSLAKGVTDTAGVVFVPCFTGLAAPHWLSSARASLSGLGLDTTSRHIARALLDGIAFCCADVIRALDDRLGGSIRSVRADGGPSQNAYLMQRQADVLGMPITVSDEPDMTALGAALLAGVGTGELTFGDVAVLRPRSRTYEPAISADQREASWDNWRRAIRSALELAKR